MMAGQGGISRIRPSCKRFTRITLSRRRQRIHPAFLNTEFQRTDGVSRARTVTAERHTTLHGGPCGFRYLGSAR